MGFILKISCAEIMVLGSLNAYTKCSGEESISGLHRLSVKVCFSHSGYKSDACLWWVVSPRVSRQCLYFILKASSFGATPF